MPAEELIPLQRQICRNLRRKAIRAYDGSNGSACQFGRFLRCRVFSAFLHCLKEGHGSDSAFCSWKNGSDGSSSGFPVRFLCHPAKFRVTDFFSVNSPGLILLPPPFCWTKFPKKVAKFKTKFPKFSPKFAPKIRPEIRPEIFRAFLAGRRVLPQNFHNNFHIMKFQISNRIPNQSSPKISQTHFCRLGSPNILSKNSGVSLAKNRLKLAKKTPKDRFLFHILHSQDFTHKTSGPNQFCNSFGFNCLYAEEAPVMRGYQMHLQSTAPGQPLLGSKRSSRSWCTIASFRSFTFWQVSEPQERKKSGSFSERISRRHSGVIPADIPGQNFHRGPPKPWKKQSLRRGHPWSEGTDVRDPKGFPNKLRSEKLENFRIDEVIDYTYTLKLLWN